jgi:hypothetical protein
MLDWLKSTFLGALGPALAFFAAVLNPAVALVLALWEGAQLVYNFIGKGSLAISVARQKYVEILAIVGESVFGQLPTQLSNAVGYFNAFFPLTEALLLAAASVIFYTLCVMLRVLKSWIPTVS